MRIELGRNSAHKAHFRCLVVTMILGAVVWMIPPPSVFAQFTSTVTVSSGTLNLPTGSTVTVNNQEGIVATNTGRLFAPGVKVTTTGANASGAAAHAGGFLQITNNSTVMTSGSVRSGSCPAVSGAVSWPMA
jgi:hypothetical protein